MGTFDSLKCHYPLPVSGANERWYQTKDTPSQDTLQYEITDKGVLRHQERYSDDWIEDTDFSGELLFYDFAEDVGWIEFSGYFENGLLKKLTLISNTTKKSTSIII